MKHNLISDSLPIGSIATFIGHKTSVYFNPYGFRFKDKSGKASLDFTEKHTHEYLKKWIDIDNSKMLIVTVSVEENKTFKIIEIKEQ